MICPLASLIGLKCLYIRSLLIVAFERILVPTPEVGATRSGFILWLLLDFLATPPPAGRLVLFGAAPEREAFNEERLLAIPKE